MTEDEAQAMLKALSTHYNQPVKPVSEYCNALWDWLFKALPQWKEDQDATQFPYSNGSLYVAQRAAGDIQLAVLKSNYLWRRIYANQPHATEKCPVHKGQWSGCDWEDSCECSFGGNVTGWLWDRDD